MWYQDKIYDRFIKQSCQDCTCGGTRVELWVLLLPGRFSKLLQILIFLPATFIAQIFWLLQWSCNFLIVFSPISWFFVPSDIFRYFSFFSFFLNEYILFMLACFNVPEFTVILFSSSVTVTYSISLREWVLFCLFYQRLLNIFQFILINTNYSVSQNLEFLNISD